MKSLSENHENHGNEYSNWLEFSLKMESNNNNNSPISNEIHNFHDYNNQEAEFKNMFFSAQEQHQHLNNNAFNFFDNVGVEGQNGKFSSNGVGFIHTPPLSIMPLKSDGSLCIVEALTRSQHSQVPKLENFLGGRQERETLNLGNIYYQQQEEQQQFESYLSAAISSCQGYSEEDEEGLLFKNWVNNLNMNVGNNSCEMQQSLSLSMSPNSQSSCVTTTTNNNNNVGLLVDNGLESNKKRGFGKVSGNKQSVVHRKSIDTFGQRTSQFRGVTKHRWTGRYEAHLWDNSCKKEGQTRKGRQVYLGGYDMEEKAARAYDLAALKYWGLQTHTNFPIESYKDETEQMNKMTRQEYVAHLRRKSSGFSRGASIYRGVTRHHQHGRWQARIGRVAGNKDLYLGTFSTQEEAGEAYDVAAIKFRGLSAVTNFDITRYDVQKIMSSNTLLAGEEAKRDKVETIQGTPSSSPDNDSDWKIMLYHNSQPDSCINHEDYVATPSFLQDLEANETTKFMSSAHFSNPSSLVTSLNSSKEVSPGGNDLVSPANVVHHPVFASWGNA